MTALAGAVSGTPVGASAEAAVTAAPAVIDPALVTALDNGESPAVLVRFRGKADLSAAFGIADRNARATYVYETLRNMADQAQSASRTTLASQYHLSSDTHDYTVLWINNSIAIQHMTPALLSSLQADPNVASVREQRVIPLPEEPQIDAPWEPMDATSSLVHIHVPEVWAEGYRGAGIVVANIDTGVRYTHHALVGKYRGNLGGGSFDHNYNWYDPYNHTATPRNTDPHGSHTMGTMIGDDGGTNQIGAAPDGKWIACIGFGFQGTGATDAGLLECGQWTLAPYPTNGTGTPDPTKHADVVNNSWGDCGRTYDPWYEDVIDGWIAAGVAPVFSNGNAPNCGYPNNPPLNTVGNPGRSGKVIGVGATGTSNGVYAPFSNKGPTDNDNPGLPTYPDPRGFPDLKPNVAAPGTNVYSASSAGDDSYFLDSGTSMSAPHTVGVIALMWSAADCIKGDWATTGTILMSTATAIPVHTGSPSDGPGDVPNQATGWGEINALAAVDAAVAHCSSGTDPTAHVTPASLTFSLDTGTSTSSPLSIGNTGGGTLNWTVTDSTTACTSPTDAPWLSEAPTSGATAGGDSDDSSITVNATSLAAGSYSAHICVASNDTAHALIDVPVSVTVTTGGTDPTASVTPTSLSFTVAAGASTSNPLTIANVGGGSLTWTATDSTACGTTSDVPWLSEAPTSGAVDGGDSDSSTITVNAASLSAGSYSGHVCIATNDTAHATVDVPVSLTVTGGGGANGIILSGPLDHAVADNILGTSLNIVTSAFDDTGPVSGDWDFNFYDIDGFAFYTIEDHATQYAVDGSGNVAVMHVGDVVGPASTFSDVAGTGPVDPAAGWLGTTDGYAGVRFECDGRLANPVPGGVCYGFVHITTTAPDGFPATIVDTGFDGDGNAITISGGQGGNDPSATVTPTSLSLTVAADETATDTLNIANAAGSNALTYSIEARGAKQPKLIAHTSHAKTRASRRPDIGKLIQLDHSRNRPAPSLAMHGASHSSPWMPMGPDGSQTFQADDGTYENTIGLNNSQNGGNESFGAVWVNRFAATGALTIDSISIEWPSGTGIVAGMQPNLLVYYDASSSGDLANAVRLGTDTIVTIAGTDAFETYPANFSVPGAGDVYIGFVDAWALVDGGFEGIVSPAAIDMDSSPGAAYLSGQSAAGVLTDLNVLANNDLTGSANSFGFPGNWMVRATASGGGGGACTGPIVNWLTANPSSGSVAGGSDTDVTITANPTAGGLGAGTYNGEICITTNDPTQTLIAVPVTLTVTGAPPQGCSAADSIFCDGFDGAAVSTIVSGSINQAVVQDDNGSAFDFALEDWHGYDGAITTDDINLYYLASGGSDGGPPGMYVYWYGDVAGGGPVGGVVDSGGTDFAVLHSGDTIGPASTLSDASISMTNWIGGADGYIGLAFWNENTSTVNYGYIHITTVGPEGFPAQALDWAYDSTGAAITIP